MNYPMAVAMASASPFLFCGALFVVSLCRAASRETPAPEFTEAQITWFKAAAKAASHRRSA